MAANGARSSGRHRRSRRRELSRSMPMNMETRQPRVEGLPFVCNGAPAIVRADGQGTSETAMLNAKSGPRIRHLAPESAPYETITVDKLTPVVGAEIGRVDLSRPLSERQ